MTSKSDVTATRRHSGDMRHGYFRFGRTPFIVYLAFLNTFVPLSTDLYLTALPSMIAVFDCPRALVDLTISGFMLCFALSMLVWGPLSDKYGRKPVLAAGLGVDAAASLVCLFSVSIYILITGRILQAAGSGAVCSVSMAIVKDAFKGWEMENALVWMQSISTIAPMLGAGMLRLTSCRLRRGRNGSAGAGIPCIFQKKGNLPQLMSSQGQRCRAECARQVPRIFPESG